MAVIPVVQNSAVALGLLCRQLIPLIIGIALIRLVANHTHLLKKKSSKCKKVLDIARQIWFNMRHETQVPQSNRPHQISPQVMG